MIVVIIKIHGGLTAQGLLSLLLLALLLNGVSVGVGNFDVRRDSLVGLGHQGVDTLLVRCGVLAPFDLRSVLVGSLSVRCVHGEYMKRVGINQDRDAWMGTHGWGRMDGDAWIGMRGREAGMVCKGRAQGGRNI